MPNMNYTSEAFEALKGYMINHFNAKTASGGKEIIKRCHFCGDSRDPTDAHLYIGMRDGVIVYNCFKCAAKGIVDGKFLRDLGCYDPNIILLVTEQNKKNGASSSTNSGKIRAAYTFQKPIIYYPEQSEKLIEIKLQYLYNRLGIWFSASDSARFKIILNLMDYLNANNITYYTRNPEMMKPLNECFIGFLSLNNSFINMRRIVKEGIVPKYVDTRYVNYNIFNTQNNMNYYVIPTSVDTTRPVEIHIAEGVFDILSIYLNVVPFGTNGVFAAAMGKSYLGLIRYLIVNFGFTGFDLHIYPDSDISNNDMIRIKEDLKSFGIRVFVHRNTFNGEKDYGVPKNRIIDSVARI